MKATELMQGDIVLYEYNGEKIHARVVEIYRSSALVESVSKEYEPIEIAEDKLSPVTITPEILEKNGFEVEKRMYWNKNMWSFGGLYIAEHKDKNICPYFWLPFGMNPTIKYVHELQHALRLCGIEKEITI